MGLRLTPNYAIGPELFLLLDLICLAINHSWLFLPHTTILWIIYIDSRYGTVLGSLHRSRVYVQFHVINDYFYFFLGFFLFPSPFLLLILNIKMIRLLQGPVLVFYYIQHAFLVISVFAFVVMLQLHCSTTFHLTRTHSQADDLGHHGGRYRQHFCAVKLIDVI